MPWRRFAPRDRSGLVPANSSDDLLPQSASPTIDPDIVTPVGPGVAISVTPNVTPQEGADVTNSGVEDLGSAATSATTLQTTRYLRLANATDQKVTVFLQYFTQSEGGEWNWLPAAPDSTDGLAIELNPGEVADARDGDWRINASKIRIWAKSADMNWTMFQNKDLWLVPELLDGQHAYESDDQQVFNYTIR